MTCAVAMGLYAQPAGDAQACPGLSTVTDYDGNVYNTVKIGTQCWMKQNLRTTHYANGGVIQPGNNNQPSTTAYYYYNNTNSEIPLSLRGYLYNWAAAMHGAASTDNVPSGVQGICPNGWHLPSYSEGWELINYLRSQSYYYCGSSSSNIARALAYTSYWKSSSNSCAIGNSLSANNASGFSAVPAGDWISIDDQGFSWNTYSAYFWTTTQSSVISGARFFHLENDRSDYSNILNSGASMYSDCGLSIRCVHTDPTVTTSSVSSSNIHPTWANCGGIVTYPYYDIAITRGVCWSTSSNPTISNSYMSSGTGAGSFTAKITGLTPQTKYYVRAYATTSLGTVYGDQVSFTTPAYRDPTVTTSSVTNISTNSATSGGTIVDSYNDEISIAARGVCWSTSSNPTISNSHTTNGTGTGSFTSSITGLIQNTTYYVRAYATTSNGTVYGSQKSFTTVCGTVNTSITGNNAIYEGQSTTLTASGSGAESYAWSNGSTGSSITVSPTTTTTYTVTGSNSCGNTSIASVTVTVTPVCLSCPEYDDYMDIYGSEWFYMSDNTEIANGCRTYRIDNVSSQYKYIFETGGEGSADFDTRLYLYNAACNQVATNDDYSGYGRQSRIVYTPTVNGTYYIKVGGWASNYGNFTLAAKRVCATPLTITGDTVIRAGKSTTLTVSGPGPYSWSNGSSNKSITVSPDDTTTYSVYAIDECGYTALASVTVTVLPICQSCPEYDATMYINNSGAWNYKSDSTEVAYGCRTYKLGNLSNQYKYTFETGGAGSANFDTKLYLYNDSCNLVNSNDDYYGTLSRLVFTPTESGTYYLKVGGYYNNYGSFTLAARKDNVPIVSTYSVTNIGLETATCGGNITEEGYSAVTARGVCWSTSPNPTIADAHTSDGTGIGAFTSSITGLSSGATYYVRAYATNSKGTAYGEMVSFSTPCPGDQCEFTFVLTDNYGDGWNGNAIQVTDAETGGVLATLTNEDLDGLMGFGEDEEVKDDPYPYMETQTILLPICDGKSINFEWVVGNFAEETSYAVYDANGEEIFSGSGGFTTPVSYTVNCASPCPAISPTYTENFDSYTQSTAAATGVEPNCWELVRTDASSMPDDKRPQLCYNSSFAHSGNYSLKMSNRCVYAMPELAEDVQVNKLRLDMFLRQANARYRLEVGIWDGQTFVPVATFDNGSTDVLAVSCDFSSYTGNGRRVAFRNSLNDGSNLAYSTNYLDDITLSLQLCEAITPPYTENFDSFTQSTAAATGVEPNCWELVRTDASSMPDDKRPQLCYNSSFAHSGNYSLKMSNRCVYAMPELAEDVQVNKLRLDMFLRQANARYRLEVGIWDGQTFVPVATFDNGSTDVLPVSCNFSSYTGNGRRIAFRNSLNDGSNLAYSTNYLDDISLSEQLCEKIAPPYTENFDSFTQSTTAATGVEPDCWELVRTDAPSMPDDRRPQLYYKSDFAHSGSYSLKLNNRCVYAMPELAEDVTVSSLKLEMYLRQANAAYQLEVGVWDEATGSFEMVKRFNNASTDVEFVTCDFSNYTGNGRRIAFRNVLGSGSYAYSVNYIDDISLTEMVVCSIPIPYTETFESYTESTTAATGVEPICWELVRTDAPSMPDDKRPQLYYKSDFAHSGNYSLKLNNRGVYAMPALSEETNIPLNRVKLEMYLRQANATYQLEVGVWDEATGSFEMVKRFNNSTTDVEFVTCDFSNYTGNGRRIAFRNVLGSGSYAYSVNYIDDISLTEIVDCSISMLPYIETFEDFTESTTAATGVEPDCWELVRTDAPSMPDDKRPQIYYNSSFASSGNYTLKMGNRCVYAMPELGPNVPIRLIALDMYLRQPNAAYRLEVGVWDEATNTFERVKLINNSTTAVEHVSCDFSGYTGNGRRIAFRNTLGSGSYAYSYNYLDDITLTRITNNKNAEVTTTDNGMLAADRDLVDVIVYPNPTKDVVNVECTMNNVQLEGIEVIDVYGKVVRNVVETMCTSSLQTRINVSGLAAGMYFVRVTTDKGAVTKPFVKR